MCVFFQIVCLHWRKDTSALRCVFISVYLLHLYATVAGCACRPAPVLLCLMLWVGGGHSLVCMALWLPICYQRTLALFSQCSLKGHTAYSTFHRQSPTSPHHLPWPATNRACLKRQMILLPGSPCLCHTHSSPHAPSASAPALGVDFHSHLHPQIRGILLSSTTPPVHLLLFLLPHHHILGPRLHHGLDHCSSFLAMKHQTRSTQERNLKSPFLSYPGPIMFCHLLLYNCKASVYPVSCYTFCQGHHPFSAPAPAYLYLLTSLKSQSQMAFPQEGCSDLPP